MKSTQSILAVIFCAALAMPAMGAEQEKQSPRLKGGEEGTVLESMTVEGEDRVSIKFERPELRIDVDPASAPGLDWESVDAVLDAAYLGLWRPLIASSAFDRTSRSARPWLDTFRTGPVAKFRPELEGVERWKLTVADSRGLDVIAFTGEGKPPRQIEWDGLDKDGNPVAPGLVYSFSLEASDKAGNSRNFLGDGFEVRPYVVQADGVSALMFDVNTLRADGTLLDVASRINQIGDGSTPVSVQVTAPAFARARDVADEVAAALRPLLLGDPSRISTVTKVEKSEDDRASIAIRVGR